MDYKQDIQVFQIFYEHHFEAWPELKPVEMRSTKEMFKCKFFFNSFWNV